MLAVLSSLLLPLLSQACLCPSCGCGGGGYGGGYSGYNGGYAGYPQQQQSVGYGQPYNVFYSQPIPAGRGVEVRAPYPYQQQNFQAQPQYLPPIQPLPQIAQQPQYIPQAPTQYIQSRPNYVQAPQIPVAPQVRPVAPVPQPPNTYELPIIPKTNLGYQPARQVETLTKLNRPVVAEVEQTTIAYTGTTRKVPAKQGKNKEYEYYYVYYDEDGKKVPGTKKPTVHDGSIQQRATTLSPENSIDEYDFDDTKTDAPTTIEPVTQAPTTAAPTEATTTEEEFIEPQGEVHSVQESTTAAPTVAPVQTKVAEPVSQEDSNGDAIYEDIEDSKTTKAPAPTAARAPETTIKVEVVTFETVATVKAIEVTTTKPATTPAPVTTAAKKAGKDDKNYEYEEYEVEEIQLVNENGVTETVTRIITTTKAPPKKQ